MEIQKKEIEKCNCKNIGLINNDWLCLECGEKVENPNIEEKPKRKKIDDSKNGDYFTFCRNKQCNQPLYKNRSNSDTRYCIECL